ncbi:hypothetical protein QJS10_CPB04g00768 [Acorus calamus]|uniref:Uncharacterized protein n=1 Tax=Acorus calamus TaxID=4465 RepID=A0AAV9EXB1_ACOCL|nr:hypothetical protein QJS10_CPB04g00768 [Acorus calamus]
MRTQQEVGEKSIENNGNKPNMADSDSKIVLCKTVWTDKLEPFETKTKKNLFREMDEHIDEQSSEKQLKMTGNERAPEDMYDVGPDTQMAAEAMEALVCEPPSNYDNSIEHPKPRNMSGRFTRSTAEENSCKVLASHRKRISESISDGITRQSKRKKLLGSS